MDSIKIGRIVEIDGLKLKIQITEDVSSRLILYNDTSDYVISINRLICSRLPCGKLAISKISKVVDKALYHNELTTRGDEQYLIEANLTGIFDRRLGRFDSGINTFPIIGSEVYAIGKSVYNRILSIYSKYRLHIGDSYHDLDIGVYADPDVLLGKHLAVIGNTGTGKSCTVASIIQGIKRRLTDGTAGIKTSSKILIFDSNNEYMRAFPETEFKVKHVPKKDLKLPHYLLNYHEYYKFVGASQGVQAPVLKESIRSLKDANGSFSFDALTGKIEEVVRAKSGYDERNSKTHFSYSQWMGWMSTMINRIDQLQADDRFDVITKSLDTNIREFLDGDFDIVIFEVDFDRDVLDAVMYLFCKIIYKWAFDNHAQDNTDSKNVLLVLEEAHRYINEYEADDYKLGNYYIERLAREGRKFDISLLISSQRPSELSKTVLSQCNSFIMHRINNKADLDFINRLMTVGDRSLLDVISGIEKQYAIVTGEAFGYSELVRIVTANPTPKSDDPKVIESWLAD